MPVSWKSSPFEGNEANDDESKEVRRGICGFAWSCGLTCSSEAFSTK